MSVSAGFKVAIGTIVVVAGLVTAVAIVVPRFPTGRGREGCLHHASILGQRFVEAREERRLDPTLHGSAQILSWLWPGGLPQGGEKLLVCPGDPTTLLPETLDDALVYHPADATALRRARGLGSYAVRDFERFPLAEDATEKQAILCDRQGDDGRTMHHKGGIVVCFSEGDAQLLSREELGLGPDEPIVVGPDSRSPMLRVFERP